MKPTNESELKFERYLGEQNLTTYDFEPDVEGKNKKIDYRLLIGDATLYLEVKEFQESPSAVINGAFDPYKRINSKIESALQNLGDYEEHCCSIVLYNASDRYVHLSSDFLLGAMLGPICCVAPLYEHGMNLNEAIMTFGDGGYLIDHQEHRVRNCHISSVIHLEDFPIGRYLFDKEHKERSQQLQRKLSRNEVLDLIKERGNQEHNYGETVLRVVVCENPFANIPLPKNIFNGPSDERYGSDGMHIARNFTGNELNRLRYEGLYPGRSPLWEGRVNN